jgi:hypothetical protein
MTLWVHYRPSDGTIVGWETGPSAYPEPGAIAAPAVYHGEIMLQPPDHRRQRVDLATLEVTDLTVREIAALNAPTMFEIRGIVAAELLDTDVYALPDLPISMPIRAQWTSYRQTLRDLSKPHEIDDPQRRPTPSEMIAAWPARPDGVDPIASIRKRSET